MKVQLRLRNPAPEQSGENFYVITESPSADEVADAIRHPSPPDGICLYGDLQLSRWDLGRHLRFYLGAPGKTVVVYQPDDKTRNNEWIRIDPAGSEDIFLVCPDMAADEYYRWPHSVFVPTEDAIQIALAFAASDGAEVDLGSDWKKPSISRG